MLHILHSCFFTYIPALFLKEEGYFLVTVVYSKWTHTSENTFSDRKRKEKWEDNADQLLIKASSSDTETDIFKKCCYTL